MPYAQVNDLNMYYEIHGEGEPVVLNNGGGGTAKSQEQRIRFLSPEYRVIAFDARGTGRTDSPDTPHTMETFADDLAGLLKELGIHSAHVFGESFGSGVAQFFVLNYPEMVRSLILASSNLGMGDQEHNPPSRESMDFQEQMETMSPEERAEAQIRLFVTQEYIDNNPDYIRKRMERMAKSASRRRPNRQMQAATPTSTYDRLPEIKAPTLVVHGEVDRIFSVNGARILAERIQNAELVTFPDTGHLLLEAGDKLYKVMLDFLKRNSQKYRSINNEHRRE